MLERFEAHQFRCFDRAAFCIDGGSVGLVGPNAAGKTSVLEGLYFLSYGRSFRVSDRRQLVRSGSEGFGLRAAVSDARGSARLAMRYATAQLAVEINDRPALGVGELASWLRAYLIDPSVHRLIEGAPQERRRLLDTGVFHVEPSYLSQWRQYRRALRQRNAALRGPNPRRAIAAWDSELVLASEAVTRARSSYIERWSGIFRSTGASFALLGGSLQYRRGWPGDLDFTTSLRDAQPRDLALGVTSVGPHRADIRVLLDGKVASRTISRGQQKLLASALVLSQLKLVQSEGEQPLLLLDDPGAELDVDNLGKFLDLISKLPVQIIATATFPTALEALGELKLFHVKQAGLVPML